MLILVHTMAQSQSSASVRLHCRDDFQYYELCHSLFKCMNEWMNSIRQIPSKQHRYYRIVTFQWCRNVLAQQWHTGYCFHVVTQSWTEIHGNGKSVLSFYKKGEAGHHKGDLLNALVEYDNNQFMLHNSCHMILSKWHLCPSFPSALKSVFQ